MTIRQYALGVVVSAGVTITGVLWYANRMPYIAGEDITACVAAAVERKWVTDWSTPAYTTTVFRKASDLVLAADLLRKAVTNASVVYLDPGTWSDGGLDMAVSHTWDGLSYAIVNQNDGVPYNKRTISLATPVSTFMNGIALSDRIIPYTYSTNTVIVTNQVPVVRTNLYIVSQTNTVNPDWAVTDRPTGTVFTYLTAGQNHPLGYQVNYNGYYSGVEPQYTSSGGWTPIRLDIWSKGKWATAFYPGPKYWGTADGSLVGTYRRLGGTYPGEVVIDYHSSYVLNPPLITTTNYIVTRYGGTNLFLYAHGQPGDVAPDVAKITPLLGNTNSWWAYKGFNEPYAMNQIETNGRPLYFITTNGLNQLRKLATNMVRTVQFDFPCSNNVVTWRADYDPVVTSYSGNSNGYDTLWTSAVSAMHSAGGTNYTEVKPSLQNHVTDYNANMRIIFQSNPTNWEHVAGMDIINRRFEYTVPTIPIEAYTNGYVKRMRVYVQYEVTGAISMPSVSWMKTLLRTVYDGWNGGYTVTDEFLTKTDENVADRFGWEYTFGGTPSFDVLTNINEDVWLSVHSLATNRIWVLAADVTSPITPPAFTLGPSDLVAETYTYPQPDYGANFYRTWYGYSPMGLRYKTYYTSIVHSALVIDWDFKIFNTTDYVPEAYTPAWVTNGTPPWVTNSP
jgi:hypothetical protein